MTDDSPHGPIKLLEKRLARAREAVQKESQKKKDEKLPSGNALGLAFRIGVELVSAIVIGLVIGLLLDYWLSTKPWLMILFILLGGAAGILNVFRMAKGFGYTVGYKRNKGTQNEKLGEKNP
jgi:ATP synthase protein I